MGVNWGEPERAPHRRERRARILYVCLFIYISYVRQRAPPYTKRIGRMKYLATISPRREKSIADHVDVSIKQDSATEQTVLADMFT